MPDWKRRDFLKPAPLLAATPAVVRAGEKQYAIHGLHIDEELRTQLEGKPISAKKLKEKMPCSVLRGLVLESFESL